MNAENIKSLIIKALSTNILVPIIQITLFVTYLVILGALNLNPRTEVLSIWGGLGLVAILCIVLWIYKIVVTISSMNKAYDFFKANQDMALADKCNFARILFIVSIVMDLIFPIVNIILYIIMLVLWFAVKDKLNYVISTNCYSNNEGQSQIEPNQAHKSGSSGCLVAAIIGVIVLFVGIAIVGILAAIALPAYSQYMSKAKFTEVVNATDFLKMQVNLCYSETNDLSKCTGKAHGFGWDLGSAATAVRSKYVSSAIVVDKGTIVVTSKGIMKGGKSSFTYVLKPSVTANGENLDWSLDSSSTCISAGLCTK